MCDEVLERCDGVHKIEKMQDTYRGKQKVVSYHQVGDVSPRPGIYVEIKKTATKGTIGEVVKVDCGETGKDGRIWAFNTKLKLKVEGRPQLVSINAQYVTYLPAHDGSTEYVRNVNTHNKVKIKKPVNKYKQELNVGDWVVGATRGPGLGIGRITRWTNHNVWAVRGLDMNDKSKEFKFDSIKETFVMPNDDFVSALTMAALKGWNGQ